MAFHQQCLYINIFIYICVFVLLYDEFFLDTRSFSTWDVDGKDMSPKDPLGTYGLQRFLLRLPQTSPTVPRYLKIYTKSKKHVDVGGGGF